MKLFSQKYFQILIYLSHVFFFIFQSSLLAQEDYQVKSLEFVGNHSFPSHKIQEQISIHGTSAFRKTILRKKAFLYHKEIVESDIKRITEFYQREGFLNVQIEEPELEINHNKKSVDIKIKINEGVPVLVENVSYQFSADSSSDDQLNTRIDKTLSRLHLVKNERFRDSYLLEDEKKLLNEINNIGHPYVEITPQIKVKKVEHKVDITWNIDTGPKCFFGDVNVVGTEKIESDLILKQVTFSKGELFQKKRIDETQNRIFALGLFHIATVKALLNPQKNKVVPVQIQIKEAPFFTTKFGFGYGKEDEFRVFSNMQLLSFLGGSRRLDLLLKHSSLEPYNIDLKYIQPLFFSYKTALTLNPFLRKEDEPGYRVTRTGIKTSILYKISSTLKSSITYIYEQVNEDTASGPIEMTTPNREDDLYNKAGPIYGLTYETSSPLFSPNSGMFILFSYKSNGLLVSSDFHYSRVLVDFRRYQLLMGPVLAYRLKIGAINSRDTHGFIPVEDRFYAGGSTSVRGWERQQLGPKDQNGIPLGGNSLLEGSIELRYPFISIVAGVIFLDFGNVWLESNNYNLNELRYSLGGGIGIDTPIGPIRLDVARPIFDKEKGFRIHLNVGHAF